MELTAVRSQGETDIISEGENDLDSDVDSENDSENDEMVSDADVESDGDDSDAETDKLQGFAGMGDLINKILEEPLTNNSDTILCKSKKSLKRKLEIKKEHLEYKEKEQKVAELRELNHVVPVRGNAQRSPVKENCYKRSSQIA